MHHRYAMMACVIPRCLQSGEEYQAGSRPRVGRCRITDAGLRLGLNIHEGHITHAAVADALHRDCLQPEKVLE